MSFFKELFLSEAHDNGLLYSDHNNDIFECARRLAGDTEKKVTIVTNMRNGKCSTVKTTTEAGITVVETYENDVLKSRRVCKNSQSSRI